MLVPDAFMDHVSFPKSNLMPDDLPCPAIIQLYRLVSFLCKKPTVVSLWFSYQSHVKL